MIFLRRKMIFITERNELYYSENYGGNDWSFSPVFLSLLYFLLFSFCFFPCISLFLLVCFSRRFFSLISSLLFLLSHFISSFFSQVFSPKKRTCSKKKKICVRNPTNLIMLYFKSKIRFLSFERTFECFENKYKYNTKKKSSFW